MSDHQAGPGWWLASDGRWYPPETTPGGPAPGAQGPRGPSRAVLWLALVGLVVVAAGLGAVLVSRLGDSEDDVAGGSPGGSTEEVLLEPLTSEGPDSFMSSTTIIDVGDGLPTTLATVPTGEGSAAGGVELVGTEPGLYGGSRDDQICDTGALVAFLDDPANAAKAEAWASVRGIEAAAIGDEVAGLTPTLLRTDTLVTNHGFAGDRATARQSVLQAGTAVLVDEAGVPAVRCSCGNPLLPPAASAGFDVTGESWDGFDPGAVVTVAPGDPTGTLTLTDVATGEPFEQPTGSASASTDAIRAVDLRNRRYPEGLCYYTPDDGYADGVTLVDGSVILDEGTITQYSIGIGDVQYGDLTGDGVEEALVDVTCSSGVGSGTFGYVLVLGVDGDDVTPLGEHITDGVGLGSILPPDIGDGFSELSTVAIDGGEIVATWAAFGPNDPFCCPSMQFTTRHRWHEESGTFPETFRSEPGPIGG